MRYKAIRASYGFLKRRWRPGDITTDTNEIPPRSERLGDLFVPVKQGDFEANEKVAERPDYKKPDPMPNAGLKYDPEKDPAKNSLPSNIGPEPVAEQPEEPQGTEPEPEEVDDPQPKEKRGGRGGRRKKK